VRWSRARTGRAAPHSACDKHAPRWTDLHQNDPESSMRLSRFTGSMAPPGARRALSECASTREAVFCSLLGTASTWNPPAQAVRPTVSLHPLTSGPHQLGAPFPCITPCTRTGHTLNCANCARSNAPISNSSFQASALARKVQSRKRALLCLCLVQSLVSRVGGRRASHGTRRHDAASREKLARRLTVARSAA
jgi:hypothetical protein